MASVGLALFLRELLRLAQGDRSWMSPQLNQPFALARAGDFVTVATPMAFLGAALRWRRRARPRGHTFVILVRAASGAPMPTIRSPPR